MKKILITAVLVLVVFAVLTAGGAWWWSRGGRPVRSGEASLAGLSAPVTVRFDRWGVPYLAAEDELDLAAALGFVHANDRFTQMELGRRAAFGRLSEVLGEATLETDVYFRTHRFGRVAESMWDDASPWTRDWLDAYARGVNAWLRRSELAPELRLLGVDPEPWKGTDSLAFAVLMARDLSFWNDRPEEERFLWLGAFGTDAVRDLLGVESLHVPEAIATAAASLTTEGRTAAAGTAVLASPGSNNWALGPSRTAAGKALVANDPHLGLFLPSVWYQVHLRSPGYEAAGMSLPGAPGVVIGRGRHVAWAFTNTMLDDHDVFFEALDEEGRRYLRGEEWKEIVVEEETIRVRGGAEHSVTLRSTDLGPLLEADEKRHLPPRSLAWTCYAGGDPMQALHGLAAARTAEEALTAIEPYVCPAQNLVAAFESGELLLTVLGRIPDRRRGDGRLPSPGWDTSYGWEGLRPRSTNPTVVAPEDDTIVTANQDIRPPGYELPLVADFFPGHRARRIKERLAKRGDWDWKLVGELQRDVVSLYARDVVEAIAGSYEGAAGDAFAVLATWDATMDGDGPAALYALLERRLLEGVFGDEAAAAGLEPFADRGALLRLLQGEIDSHWFDDVSTASVEGRPEALAAALAGAFDDGRRRWGEDVGSWPYPELHQLTLRHRLDAVPVLGGWMRRGPFGLSGSATTVAAFGARWRDDRLEVVYGPSMRWVVDWSQPETSFAALPGGQSGHPADPHYDDQLRRFLDGKLHPAPWAEEQIKAAVVSRLRLVP